METYYQVSTVYERLDEEGNPNKVRESYLTDAISCSDAELKVTKEVQPFSNGEFKITNVHDTKIVELFKRDVEGFWYACRLAMIVTDDKGKDKRIPVLIYVKAENVKDAESFVVGELKKGMQTWVVVSITETKIVDVI